MFQFYFINDLQTFYKYGTEWILPIKKRKKTITRDKLCISRLETERECDQTRWTGITRN